MLVCIYCIIIAGLYSANNLNPPNPPYRLKLAYYHNEIMKEPGQVIHSLLLFNTPFCSLLLYFLLCFTLFTLFYSITLFYSLLFLFFSTLFYSFLLFFTLFYCFFYSILFFTVYSFLLFSTVFLLLFTLLTLFYSMSSPGSV